MPDYPIPEDLLRRYNQCCDPDGEWYSAWECTLIERIATLTDDLNEANNDYRELLIERDNARVVQQKYMTERDEALRENERLKEQIGNFPNVNALRQAMINTADENERLKADAHNLKSPIHAICNHNLTEALAAAIEQTQTIELLKAQLARHEAPVFSVSIEEEAFREKAREIIANRAKPQKEGGRSDDARKKHSG